MVREEARSDDGDSGALVKIIAKLRSQLLLGAIAFGLVFALVADKPLAWTVPGVFIVFGALDTVLELRKIARSRAGALGASLKTGRNLDVGGSIVVASGTTSKADLGRDARTGKDLHVLSGTDAWRGGARQQRRPATAPEPPQQPSSKSQPPSRPQSQSQSPGGARRAAEDVESGDAAQRSGSSVFIGRRAELALACELLDGRGPGVLLDVTGVHGVGKSRFLAELIGEAERRGMLAYVRNLADEGVGEGFADDHGDGASFGMLYETLNVAKHLFTEISNEFGSPKVLRSIVQKHEQSTTPGQLATVSMALGHHASVRGNLSVHNTILPPDIEVAKAAVRDQLQRLEDRFVAAWTRFTAERPVLLVFDTFELVADDEIGLWITSLAPRLPNTVTAVSRIPSQQPVRGLGRRTRNIDLVNFSLAETAAYLDRHLSACGWLDEFTILVHEHTAGHPGGVELATVYANRKIAQHGEALNFATVRSELTAMDGKVSGDWAGLVELILDEVNQPQVTAAVESAAVTTRFTVPMLAALLKSDQPDEVAGIVHELHQLHLLRPPVFRGDDEQPWERLHTFIQRAMVERIRTGQPDKWQHQNELAATFCFDQLKDLEENDAAYGSWFRFENPRWQEYKQAWLYYTARSQRDPQLDRARFTRVFLEVFFWWGCYFPFPYNRHLIEDWDRFVGQLRRGPGRDAGYRLRDALVYVLDHYPSGHVKADAPWAEIEDALLELKDLCGVGPGIQRRSHAELESFERVRGLIDIFLAHARRFRDPLDLKAIQYYDEALAQFRAQEDDWVTAWLLRERADLALEGGRYDEAFDFAGQSARLASAMYEADQEWDHELVADLNRIAADVSWSTGERRLAASLYAGAVLESYLMQADGEGHLPDEYTAKFYVEMSDRVVERIFELARGAGPEEITGFASVAVPTEFGMDRETIPALPGLLGRTDDKATIIQFLFPRPPSMVDGGDQEFLRLWRRHHQEIPPTADTLSRLFAVVAPERSPDE